MSVAEMEAPRTVRELQMIFKNGYEKKVTSENRISECNKGFRKIKDNSKSSVNHVQALQSTALRDQINDIEGVAQRPQTLDDPKLIELKESLNTLFYQYDDLELSSLKVSNLESLPKYPKNILLNDEQFLSLSKEDDQVVEYFKETAGPLKSAHRQRVILGEEIEKETLRVVRKRRFIRNSFIMLIVSVGGGLFALRESNPQMFEHYLNLVKGLLN
ncbi:hypothetical protein [Vibrio sp. OPT18]|uniref:hypothetical protein n=1 Tax=Vibrio sp. OPT18 TaxID=2778641 RepID=UPI0018805441|nr:hypothetical protein [Vibrio sp. OPT18]MBE8577988.1 hypothetical protein [Vibrio sp. OPT18]